MVIVMLQWLRKIRAWLAPIAANEKPSIPRPVRYKTMVFNDRSAATHAAHQDRVLAVVESAGKRKWVLLRCPCGCGEDLALNLMRSHRPVWEVVFDRAGQASLHPSVHATTCGAHFWLRNGAVTWCE